MLCCKLLVGGCSLALVGVVTLAKSPTRASYRSFQQSNLRRKFGRDFGVPQSPITDHHSLVVDARCSTYPRKVGLFLYAPFETCAMIILIVEH
jgi:hypothetical protein